MSNKYNDSTHLTKKQIKEGKETVEVFHDLDESALKSEKFIEKYAKQLTAVFLILVLAVLGYFAYQQFVMVPRNDKATLGYLAAQKNLALGDDAKALGGKSAANPGFIGTYQEYKGTAAGKLSAYSAGIIKFNEGKYQQAYDLLDAFSSDNKILMALKYGAMGDCMANLNKGDDAMKLYDKATSVSDDPFTMYYFTRKAGLMAIALKKNSDAKKYFEKIEDEYQDFDAGASDAYIEMVKYFK
ncbi:YfgM family protein [Riemerella columbipharyngis]|nr:hypothetical protein [Riemerella columbipharyngis]